MSIQGSSSCFPYSGWSESSDSAPHTTPCCAIYSWHIRYRGGKARRPRVRESTHRHDRLMSRLGKLPARRRGTTLSAMLPPVSYLRSGAVTSAPPLSRSLPLDARHLPTAHFCLDSRQRRSCADRATFGSSVYPSRHSLPLLFGADSEIPNSARSCWPMF